MYSIYHLKREHHTFVDFIDLDGESPPDHLYELKPPGFLYFCAFHNSSCDLLAHVNCYAFISWKVNTVEHNILEKDIHRLIQVKTPN